MRRFARSRAVAREGGQALVEFVLILPVFLLLVFGMIEFGKGFNYWIDMTHLANEGARYASVNRWPTCPAIDTDPCTEQLRKWIKERANTGELATTLRYSTPPNTAKHDAGGDGVIICFPQGGSPPQPGEAVRVIVRTTYTLDIVDGLLGAIGLDEVGQLDIAASATMRIERAPSSNRLLLEDAPSCPT